MTMISKTAKRRYQDIVKPRLLRVIQTKAQYEAVSKEITRLLTHEPISKAEEDYLETLSLLIEHYEELHYPIDTTHITPLEALEKLLADQGMTHADLGRLLGNARLGSEIIKGKKALTEQQAEILSERFKLHPDFFLKTY